MPVKVWLSLYNQALGIGWLYILAYMTAMLLLHGSASFSSSWEDLGPLVCKLQALVLLDTIHAASGFWPPDRSVTIWQRLWCKVGHRTEIFITIYIIGFRGAADWSAGPLILTWAMADVSRYQLYFLRSLGQKPPSWLQWLRYSDFIVQYPLNILAEAYFVYKAIPHLTKDRWGALTYAPVAVAFQIYEWYIFVPAFKTLWGIRKRRLQSFAPTWSMPSQHCLSLRA